MSDPSHVRKLEKEMVEARSAGTDYDSMGKDPLLLILYRLNHQDRTLEEIEIKLSQVGTTLANHITTDDQFQDSIVEMVSMWKGSKLVGRILSWSIGIIAAGGAIVTAALTINKGGF